MSLKVVAIFLLGLCAVALAGHMKMAPATGESSSMGSSGVGGTSGVGSIPFGTHIRLQVVNDGAYTRVARSPRSHSSSSSSSSSNPSSPSANNNYMGNQGSWNSNMGSQGSMQGSGPMMNGPAPIDAIIVPWHDHSAGKKQ